MINEKYLVKVKELPLHLPRLRRPLLKEDRCETLDELPLIFVECELNEI